MQGQQINPMILLEEYKNTILNMTEELIMLRAYVKQLEQQLQQTKETQEQ